MNKGALLELLMAVDKELATDYFKADGADMFTGDSLEMVMMFRRKAVEASVFESTWQRQYGADPATTRLAMLSHCLLKTIGMNDDTQQDVFDVWPHLADCYLLAQVWHSDDGDDLLLLIVGQFKLDPGRVPSELRISLNAARLEQAREAFEKLPEV